MTDDLTDLKIQLGRDAIELANRAAGLGPDAVSRAAHASHCGLSESTLRRIERVALAKLRLEIANDPEIPAHLARKALQLLQTP